MSFSDIVDKKLLIDSIQSRGTPYTAEDGSQIFVTFASDNSVSWTINDNAQAGQWNVTGDEYNCNINVDETEDDEEDWEEDMNFILCTILTQGKYEFTALNNNKCIVFTGAGDTGKITLRLDVIPPQE